MERNAKHGQTCAHLRGLLKWWRCKGDIHLQTEAKRSSSKESPARIRSKGAKKTRAMKGHPTKLPVSSLRPQTFLQKRTDHKERPGRGTVLLQSGPVRPILWKKEDNSEEKACFGVKWCVSCGFVMLFGERGGEGGVGAIMRESEPWNNFSEVHHVQRKRVRSHSSAQFESIFPSMHAFLLPLSPKTNLKNQPSQLVSREAASKHTAHIDRLFDCYFYKFKQRTLRN